MKTNKYYIGLSIFGALLLTSNSLNAAEKIEEKEPIKIDIIKPIKTKPINVEKAIKTCRANKGLFLQNGYIYTCVTPDGTFGTHSKKIGMIFDYDGRPPVQDIDYLQPGSPHEFFSITINNKTYTNNNRSRHPQINTVIRPLNRASNQLGGVVSYSKLKGASEEELQIIQKYTVDPNSREIIVRVEIKNMGEETLSNIYYARGIDPDQDYNINKNFKTVNQKGGIFGNLAIDNRNIVQASGRRSNRSIALYSVDKVPHNTCISPRWTTNAQTIYQNKCFPSYQQVNYSDSTINISFNIKKLEAHETKVFSFKYLFDKSNIRSIPSALIENSIKEIEDFGNPNQEIQQNQKR